MNRAYLKFQYVKIKPHTPLFTNVTKSMIYMHLKISMLQICVGKCVGMCVGKCVGKCAGIIMWQYTTYYHVPLHVQLVDHCTVTHLTLVHLLQQCTNSKLVHFETCLFKFQSYSCICFRNMYSSCSKLVLFVFRN